MKINQLSLSFAANEIMTALQGALERSPEKGAAAGGVKDFDFAFKNTSLVISTKKKLGFMPMKLAATIGLRPTAEGDGIVITLEKLSAGVISAQALISQFMGQIAQALAGVPGCKVSGNSVTFLKSALDVAVPWLSIPGKINKFGIENNQLVLEVG